jgi:alkylhydroperoxidase family enzyme
VGSHAAVAAELLGDRETVQAIVRDYRTAPISDKDRALYHLIARAVEDSTQIRHADLDEARAAGWSDEALYDAITVHALFQFYNAWVDVAGVQDMPAAMYAMSGQRLATQGYAGMVEDPRP